MTYKLSKRSIERLAGVDERLVDCVQRAIELTTVDFAVTEGVRTKARQIELFNKGASQIRDGGTHVEGRAVDLVAFIGDRISWELNLYDDIALAMASAAREIKLPLRWGAAWNIPDITKWNGTMEAAMQYYIDSRRKQNERPFIDAQHFEIVGK
jgi:peptidoglycan L-alanyl-D-glutamate endopeptidase CwlK